MLQYMSYTFKPVKDFTGERCPYSYMFTHSQSEWNRSKVCLSFSLPLHLILFSGESVQLHQSNLCELVALFDQVTLNCRPKPRLYYCTSPLLAGPTYAFSRVTPTLSRSDPQQYPSPRPQARNMPTNQPVSWCTSIVTTYRLTPYSITCSLCSVSSALVSCALNSTPQLPHLKA